MEKNRLRLQIPVSPGVTQAFTAGSHAISREVIWNRIRIRVYFTENIGAPE